MLENPSRAGMRIPHHSVISLELPREEKAQRNKYRGNGIAMYIIYVA